MALADNPSKRLLNAPSEFSQSLIDHVSVYPGSSSPLHKVEGLSSPCYSSIISFVVCLLDGRRPLAICRFIVAVIVNSVNRVITRWPYPHIAKKCRETAPFLTHSYSPSAIVCIVSRQRVEAPISNSTPCSIFDRFRHSVNSCSVSAQFSANASAGCRCSSSQGLGVYFNQFSASAHAEPLRFMLDWIGLRNHRPEAKFLAGNIGYFHMSIVPELGG